MADLTIDRGPAVRTALVSEIGAKPIPIPKRDEPGIKGLVRVAAPRIVIFPDRHGNEGAGGLVALYADILSLSKEYEITSVCFESSSNKRAFYAAMPKITEEELQAHVNNMTRPELRWYYKTLMELLIKLSAAGIEIIPIDADITDERIRSRYIEKRTAIKTLRTTTSFNEALQGCMTEARLLGEADLIREPAMRDNIAAVASKTGQSHCVVVIVGAGHAQYLENELTRLGFNAEVRGSLTPLDVLNKDAIRQAARGSLDDVGKLSLLRFHFPAAIKAQTLQEARSIFEQTYANERRTRSKLS